MAGKKVEFPIPNLSNMTDAMVIDELGRYRQVQAEAKFYEGFYKEQVTIRLGNNISGLGEKFEVKKTEFNAERFDITQCRADADAGDELAKKCLARWLKNSTTKQLRTSLRAAPDPNVAPTNI
jgi:hypothetical protein